MAKEEFPSLKEYEKKVSEEMELTDLERYQITIHFIYYYFVHFAWTHLVGFFSASSPKQDRG
jgi:hypothetical protein